MRWLILGGRANALAVARALDRPELVSCVDLEGASAVVASSRYISRLHTIAADTGSVHAFLDEFLAAAPAILIATDDWWLYQAAVYRESAGKPFYGLIPESRELKVLLDKQALYARIGDAVRMPPMLDPQESNRSSRAVVKPRLPFDETGIVLKGLNDVSQYQQRGIDCIVQQKIDAPLTAHLSVSGLADRGKLFVPFFSRKILEYPSPMGTATMVQNIQDATLMSRLREAAELVLARTLYTGIFELEFIEANGELWLIDFNPRFWLQHELAIGLGINYALLYSRASQQGFASMPVESDAGAAKRLLWIHEGAPLSFFKAGWREKLRVLRLLFGAKPLFAHLRFDDPKPFWYFLRCHLKNS